MKRIEKLQQPMLFTTDAKFEMAVTDKINEIIDELNARCFLPDVEDNKAYIMGYNLGDKPIEVPQEILKSFDGVSSYFKYTTCPHCGGTVFFNISK